MAYIKPDTLLTLLPGKGRGVSSSEAKLYLARAQAMLEYEPETEREEALAEGFVETWAHGQLLRIQAQRDGFLETPTADAMITEATTTLSDYNDMRVTPDGESPSWFSGSLDVASTFPPLEEIV